MIKNIILSIIMIFGLCAYSGAQTDNRTRETKIADIVMLLPADNSATFNKLMGELYALGNVVGDLSPRLSEPGGNDAQIRYAVAGLAMYASKNAEYKSTVAKDLCKSVSAVKSDEIRDFLLIQLQYVAGDESVETASKYLHNDRLCDAAARVLVRIGNDNARKTLLGALKESNAVQKSVLVQSFGELKYAGAVADITQLLSTANVPLKKVALHSLAAIAAPESENILNEAAAKAGYVYEPTGALESYLLYLENRLNGNGAKQTLDASKKLLAAVSEGKQIAAKTTALWLYVKASACSDESKAVGEISNALKSANKQYRLAALDCSMLVSAFEVNLFGKSPLFAQKESKKMYDVLLNLAQKDKNPEIRAEVIGALGIRGYKDAAKGNSTESLNTLKIITEKCLTDKNPAVVQASVEAIGKICGAVPSASYVSQIIKAMDTDNAAVVETGKAVLLSLKSDKLVNEAESTLKLSKTSKLSKIAFLEILAARKADDKFETVYSYAQNPDNDIRKAAIGALKNVSREKDAPLVAQLLNVAADKESAALLQDALYTSVSSLSTGEQTKRVTGLLKTGRNPAVYYNVYAKIGGSEALRFVLIGMESETTGDAAFEAMTNWSDDAVLPALINIAKSKNKYSERALTAYISKTDKSSNKPEQKLLMLRNALEIAQTDTQKISIIRAISYTGTFSGLLVAGNYLDDKNQSIQQAAVQAVRKIALSNKSYYGAKVSELLNKAIAVNKDSEASYQREEILKHLASLPKDDGFVSLFNGKNLDGWKGLVKNPIERAKMKPSELKTAQAKADELARQAWSVENGVLMFNGKGDNLCTDKLYGDFELYVDWKLYSGPEPDAGIYLRGTPQVQIWDTSRVNVGAQVGSGGLYNNAVNPKNPLVVADNPLNEWNSFHIQMIGERVTVYLNGELVVDNVILENYWDRKQPIFPVEQIELQAHGSRVAYRDIYVREIPRQEPYEVSASEKTEGFVPMFNGIDMSGWVGNLTDYVATNGTIRCLPVNGGHGNLYTEKEYSDFVMRFEFKLTPAANNGLGIRTPLEGDAAYVGMELQILDNEAEVYKNLEVYQYHGSVYGVIAAKRGFQKPVGEWNVEEVTAIGNKIKIVLNGTVILEGDIAKASKNFTETIDHKAHPGLSNKSGHIGFLGHGSEVEFRNLRIKDMKKK